ncbi:DUF4179 domain-containing protein [Lysinibacillus sp. fls2-241-R2A-57]|uniref:DUF4179 domain-containing protein n=1 Tax=Lysinibacillus sp. fls2-241-R2A-57 TaxID=3040292 RepID=UPI002553BDEB|nr:DUF4179 domain-containing protein [Lysinibacillus sp. fls2-241-R2A-57]
MERIENKVKKQMKESNNVDYPDFDQMWSSIQQDELKVAGGEPVVLRSRKRKRFALVAGLSVALLATPVYAALNYDWSSMLSHREGIQSALEQGLGQKIEQSVTKEGVTLTVHTAFIDENRTVLLYSLKPETSQDVKDIKDIDFKLIGLKDSKGNFIEGNYKNEWNEELGEFQGFFETDWVAEGQTTDVEFIMENIQFIGNKKQSISYNPNDSTTQVFPIQKDGVGSVTLQSFEQAAGKVLLRSDVTLTDNEMPYKCVELEAINDVGESVKQVQDTSFSFRDGKSNVDQLFKSETLRREGTKFQISYEHILETKESTWSTNINLSKKQMENGSYKQVLDIPMGNVPNTKIHEMKVTPTQVRLLLTQDEYKTIPFKEYQLDVGGTLLTGHEYFGSSPNKLELRFEVKGLDVASLANQPVAFVAKHRVDGIRGDDNPIRLTDISVKPQSLTSSIAGYPITWTYYLKDNNLYVESLSSDPAFVGVNQTYYLDGDNGPIFGRPDLMGILEDGSNKAMDVYENFNKKELDIYIEKYLIDKPNEELRIPLKSGK